MQSASSAKERAWRDRPALSRSRSGRQAVEALWRIESARIVGTLARVTGDFALAEDLAQEALADALVAWPRDGVPRNPAGWLLTVGRRRAIDSLRRRSASTTGTPPSPAPWTRVAPPPVVPE